MERRRVLRVMLGVLPMAALAGWAGPPYNPVINPAQFVAQIDNPYFTLTPGATRFYRAQTTEGTETQITSVTNETKLIMGVTTRVIHDQVFLDGVIIEDTFDWYAQDIQGNVWYFGEDSTDYVNGVPVGHAGSWEAGVDGAKPGIMMKGVPKVGDKYRQEYAAGVAEDWGQIKGLNASVAVPYGVFTRCLKTRDWSGLEPGNTEYKYYRAGVGLVLEVNKDGERNELTGIQ